MIGVAQGDQGDLTDQILFPADSDFTAPSELAVSFPKTQQLTLSGQASLPCLLTLQKESEIDSLLYKAFMERSEEYDQLYQQRTDMYSESLNKPSNF